MYIMRKMNREKKALTDAQRVVLLAEGYKDITPVHQEELSSTKESPAASKPIKKEKEIKGKMTDKVREPVKKAENVTETEGIKEIIEKDRTVSETQQSAKAADSVQEQPTEPTVFVQQPPEKTD